MVPRSRIAAELGRRIPKERVRARWIDRVAFASDASMYRLVPQAVVLANGLKDIRHVLEVSRATGAPICFRAAGTSLSGQSVTDGILVEVSRFWRGIEVLEQGAKVWVQPGAIGGHVNLRLMPFGAKIGPDPASIAACQMGGILANNASGMCCGVAQNAYHTLESIRFLLPNGVLIDSSSPTADRDFESGAPELHQELSDMRDGVRANAALSDRIRRKYRIKNTVGYGLNAFLDFEIPVDIFAHLLIGSEGTLAFIESAVLRTVPSLPVKSTAFFRFPNIQAACLAIQPLAEAGAAAVEMMDFACIRSVIDYPGLPAELGDIQLGEVVLLAEVQGPKGADPLALRANLEGCGPALFARDPNDFWKIRKGIFPAVAAKRPLGTTVVIEDVAFPPQNLAAGFKGVRELLDWHGYAEGVLFGHAKDGNLHFAIAPSFSDPGELKRYEAFMADIVQLTLRLDGSLKGEHGTGRNMAPFVEAEWGKEAYA